MKPISHNPESNLSAADICDLQTNFTDKTNMSSHPTALRLLEAHARTYGVNVDDLKAKELARGQVVDQRVSMADIEHVQQHGYSAQIEFADRLQQRAENRLNRLKVLNAPTSRVVDHLLEGEGFKILVEQILANGKLEELRCAINDGPPDGSTVWSTPTTPIELVASIVRWAALTENDKKRIRVSRELRGWIHNNLEEHQYHTRPRLGGVGAVATLLARALEHDGTMMTLGPVPKPIVDYLGPNTPIVSADPKAIRLADVPNEKDFEGNFCILNPKSRVALPEALRDLRVNGKHVELSEASDLDILVTGSKSQRDFAGISLERSLALGQQFDLVILNNAQYQADRNMISEFTQHAVNLHSGGAVVALPYAEGKFPALETDLFFGFKKASCIDFFALNTVEAPELLRRFKSSLSDSNPLGINKEISDRIDAALALAEENTEVWEDGFESPEFILESSMLIQHLLAIPVVRVRGMAFDAIAVAPELKVEDPDALSAAQTVSRYLGAVKAATTSGLIENRSDIPILTNPPDGTYVAALYKASDYLAKRFEGHPFEDNLLRNFSAKLPDGMYISLSVPIPLYDKSGGTTSAGDTKDASFAMEAIDLLRAAHRLQEQRCKSDGLK